MNFFFVRNRLNFKIMFKRNSFSSPAVFGPARLSISARHLQYFEWRTVIRIPRESRLVRCPAVLPVGHKKEFVQSELHVCHTYKDLVERRASKKEIRDTIFAQLDPWRNW